MEDDWALLRRYIDEQKEEAFTELVQRHAGWLLNALIRQLRDYHAAVEVRQQVFTLLAQKSTTLKSDVHVGGWLFTAARNVAAHHQRGDRRRNFYLNQAGRDPALIMNTEQEPSDAEIDTQIDSAIAALPEEDQQAILLRFFAKRSGEHPVLVQVEYFQFRC